MTLTFALSAPLPQLRYRDLWAAVRTIGAFKLDVRQGMKRTALAYGTIGFANPTKETEELRSCNRRIDELLMEEESRNLREKRERMDKRGAAA